MPDAKTMLLLCLAVVAAAFAVFWTWSLRGARHRNGATIAPTPNELLVGSVTDFLDTLGIGSFATTTALYRARRTIDDRLLPGTLTSGTRSRRSSRRSFTSTPLRSIRRR